MLVTTVLGDCLQAQTQPASRPVERPAIAGRRILKHFDFNERPLGNYTTLPISWRRHGSTGFPLFLEGKFDESQGRSSAPSFRLDLDGGSLGYHYEGRDIAVRTNSDYLVVAWIRTSELQTARAYITACYLDRKGNLIPGTDEQSAVVGGADTPDEWTPVTVALRGGVPQSRYIGLALWLTQSPVWDTTARPPHHIEREDVKGSAWFDDITVYRLPRAILDSARPGHVFTDGEQVELKTEVSDPDGLHLQSRLTVRSVEGAVIDEREVPIQPFESADVQSFRYDLPAGLYQAELVVQSEETVLVRRSLRFIRFESPITGSSGTLGVLLRDLDPRLLSDQVRLLAQLQPRCVKLPIWCAQRPSAPAQESRGLDHYIEQVISLGAEPVGILVNDETPPADDPARKVRSLVDMLSDDPAGWKPLIAGVWTRYAGLVHVWQVGEDGDEATGQDPRLTPLLRSVREHMMPITGTCKLAAVSDGWQTADPARSSDFESVRIPPSVAPDEFEAQARPAVAAHAGHTWLLVEPLHRDEYPRELRLADLARRLAEAMYLEPAGVFVEAPWDTHADPLVSQVDPTEDMIIIRTLSDVLSGCRPVSRMTLDGQVQCLVFDRGGRAVVMVWDALAPPDGREQTLLLGDGARQVDIWGRTLPMSGEGEVRTLRVGPVPTFVLNTPTWLMEFRRNFVLDPPTFEASFDAHSQSVRFLNTFHQPVSGLLHIVAPPDWDIRPSRMAFVLQPGEEFRQAISVRFPLNAEAGLTPLVGEFFLDADRRYQLLVPAWFELGLRNIDLDTYVYRVGDRVVVRQSMTNHTQEAINFESYLIAPSRARVNRTFANCKPKQSMFKDFVLDQASDLVGQKVRVSLKESQGTRVWNRVITIP